MIDENLDLATVVTENSVVLEIIEFTERHMDGPAATFRQESQNAIGEENAAVRRSFPPHYERHKTGIGECNRGRAVFQYVVILCADIRFGQQVVGALERGEIAMG